MAVLTALSWLLAKQLCMSDDFRRGLMYLGVLTAFYYSVFWPRRAKLLLRWTVGDPSECDLIGKSNFYKSEEKVFSPLHLKITRQCPHQCSVEQIRSENLDNLEE